MYKKQPFYTVRSIRFRRWSRKSYAAFLSLKRHVTIGCVGKSIAEASLHKGGMFHAEKNQGTSGVYIGSDTGCEEPDTGETDVRLLMGELCPQVTLVIGPAKEYAYSLVKHIRKHAGNNGMFTGIQRRLMQAFIDREKVGEAGVNLRFFIH